MATKTTVKNTVKKVVSSTTTVPTTKTTPVTRLTANAPWFKFMAILSWIGGGVGAILSLPNFFVTLPAAAVAIWLGFILWKAAKGAESNDPAEVAHHISDYMKIQGILNIIGIIVGLFALVIFGVFFSRLMSEPEFRKNIEDSFNLKLDGTSSGYENLAE